MAPKTPATFREASLADVAAMAEVASAGFMADGFFGSYMHPKRKEFPDDWNFYWQKEIRTHIVNQGSKNYVCVDDASGRIVGLCLVQRLGDGKSTISDPTFKKAQRAFTWLQNLWVEKTWTDRSADPGNVAKFEKNWDDIEHHFSGARKECWLVNFLCVHPDFWYKGLGEPLVNKAIGLGDAESPKVPVAVISSKMGDRHYQKWGFEEVGRADVGDLSGIQGGSIKFYEKHLRDGS